MGIQRQCLLIGGFGFSNTGQRRQRIAEIDIGIGKFWITGDRLLMMADGFFGFAGGGQSHPQRIEHLGSLGPVFQRVPVMAHGQVGLALLHRYAAQIEMRLDIVGPQCDGTPETVARLDRLAGGVQDIAQGIMDFGQLWRQFQGAPGGRFGLAGPAQADQRGRQIVPSSGEAGGKIGRFAKSLGGLLEIFDAHQGNAQIVPRFGALGRQLGRLAISVRRLAFQAQRQKRIA